MSDPINVFVYGTLLFSEVTDQLGITSKDPATGDRIPLARHAAVLDGFARFTVRLRANGNFPAIVRGEGSVVGELLECVSTESLERLDYFEGIADGHYHREMVQVRRDDELVDAFTYVCGNTLQQYLDGPWDVDAFRKNDLKWYVNNVVEPL